MTPVVIWGAGGHARVAADILCLRGEHRVVAHLDDGPEDARPAAVGGVPVLGGEEGLSALRASGVQHLLVAFGHNRARLERLEMARAHGFRLVTAVHPSAVVAADVRLGEGTLVAANAVLNPGCTVGIGVIVNTAASIDHDCALGDGASVAPGARLAGWVQVGRLATVGIGATVVDRVGVGENALVGAGAVVVKDIPKDSVAYGAPARVVRIRRPDE